MTCSSCSASGAGAPERRVASRRGLDRVEQLERDLGVRCDFEDVVTHHAKHVVYERASQDTNWIVKGWKSRSPWRLIPDPVAWFIHHPPCNLLLFRDHVGLPGNGIKYGAAARTDVYKAPNPPNRASFEHPSPYGHC